MADDKILIEIQLDDGSVVKGLAKIQKGVDGVAKSTKGVGDQVETAFSGTAIGNASNKVNNFISTISNLHPALKLASVAIAATGFAIERAFAGEAIEAIGKQFNLLSDQAGVSASKIQSALVSVADGAIDTEDLLKSTSKFLVEFGSNAERIPEVLNIARKATALFGGEVTQNFEQIAQAIASGQTRSLKGLGIIVDQEAAYKKFAESIGVSASQLSEAGKKQAILDEVIRKGGETFKNIDPSINQLSLSYEKLKVQIGEVADTVAIKSNSAFGSFFTGILNTATNALTSFNQAFSAPPTGMDAVAQSISDVEKKIISLNNQIKIYNDASLGTADLSALENQKEKLNSTLENLQMQYDKFRQGAAVKTDEVAKDNSKFVDQKILSENISKANSLVSQANIDRINSQMSLDTTLEVNKSLQNEKLLALDAQLNEKISAMDIVQKGKSVQEVAAYEELKTQLTLKGEADRQKLIQDYAIQNGETVRFSNQYIAQGISNAVSQTVMAVKKGQNAFKAFTGAIFGLIGDMVTQIGTTLIGIGLGMEAIRASIVGLTGGPALFAGVALVALGTLLKSLSGGAGGGASTSAPSSGGSSSSVSSEQPDIPGQNKPQSQIAVNIQGDVLDSSDTGIRIVDIIRQYADKNGGMVTA